MNTDKIYYVSFGEELSESSYNKIKKDSRRKRFSGLERYGKFLKVRSNYSRNSIAIFLGEYILIKDINIRENREENKIQITFKDSISAGNFLMGAHRSEDITGLNKNLFVVSSDDPKIIIIKDYNINLISYWHDQASKFGKIQEIIYFYKSSLN